jgi:hypothetical protein
LTFRPSTRTFRHRNFQPSIRFCSCCPN